MFLFSLINQTLCASAREQPTLREREREREITEELTTLNETIRRHDEVDSHRRHRTREEDDAISKALDAQASALIEEALRIDPNYTVDPSLYYVYKLLVEKSPILQEKVYKQAQDKAAKYEEEYERRFKEERRRFEEARREFEEARARREQEGGAALALAEAMQEVSYFKKKYDILDSFLRLLEVPYPNKFSIESFGKRLSEEMHHDVEPQERASTNTLIDLGN